MREKGRNTSTITVRLPNEAYDYLEEIAEKAGRGLSEYLRRILTRNVERAMKE